ncbi:HAD family hydrolase [Streptomyces globisporus]|uniref:HAD family hydrolase n=1 Tax=Streptomyces globisporus TaxID=1908 RepID=UPI000E2B30D2|nr:HAD family hydrolase [Streptomyces sp. HB202]RDL08623.1 phosphoglycolate phosphatase [Streptomyces sp. HB202]WSF76462.1 HAD family hydrolase [Streptomyces globisporus]GGV98986.1 phosphoglycolate phosphatase [Streptomyces globisporus]
MSAERPAILFDLDGTLLDTPGAIANTLHRVLAETGHGDVPDERVRATVGRPLTAVFADLTGSPEGSAPVAEAVALFRELFRRTVVPEAAALVFPGIPDLLRTLRRSGYRTAVVTSKIRPSAMELLEPAALVDQFDAIICHGMAERGKPHPDLALLAAERIGSPAHLCTVVGDAVDDMRMAAGAGMRAIGVTYGVASARQLTASGAVQVVETVADLARSLGREPSPPTAPAPRAAPVPLP